MQLPLWMRRLWRQMLIETGNTYVSKSGQLTKRHGYLEMSDERRFITLPLNETANVDYSVAEITAITIQCAWCAKPIFVGDYVTLYGYRGNRDSLAPHIVIYDDSPLRVVGCLRMACAETGADYQGMWQPDPENPGKGHVLRIQSPIEMLAANPDIECIMV